MTSGKFILRGMEDPKKDACVRFLLVLILLSVTAVAILVGCYAFNSDQQTKEGCNKQPELDPYGLSNWTLGGQIVAFGCFPGHQIEGHDEVVLSQCIDNSWVPPPPACADLPILLKCQINQNGLEGSISMWQKSDSSPTVVHGILNIRGMDEGQVAQQETIQLSRTTCEVSSDLKDVVTYSESNPVGQNQIEVHFSSNKLLAYKKAQLRVTLISIDLAKRLRTTIVSIHQGQEVLVMNIPIPEQIAEATVNENQGTVNAGNPSQSDSEDSVDAFNLNENENVQTWVGDGFPASSNQAEDGETETSESQPESDAPSEHIPKPLGV